MKLSPAFRLRLHASARPLFILAEARLVPDVTRLRRVLATRLLHSRQGWCRRAQTGLRALPLPAFITWQFTMVRSRRTRHLRCTHNSSRSTHRIRTRLTSKIPFWVSRKQFLARVTFETPFRACRTRFRTRGQNNAAYKVIPRGCASRETGQNIFRSRAVSRVAE